MMKYDPTPKPYMCGIHRRVGSSVDGCPSCIAMEPPRGGSPAQTAMEGWEDIAEGLKFDQDKPRMDLIDAYATEELARVLTFGAKKYAANNWRKGISYGRLLAAILRHAFAIMRGEWLDPETNLPHAAHIQCTAMFLTWMGKERPDLNDIWKGNQ